MKENKRDHCWSQYAENSSSKKHSAWSITQHGYKAIKGGGK